MKPSVKVAFVCSFITILITLGAYYNGKSELWFNKGALITLFLLMSSIAIGVFLTKKKDNYKANSFLDDFKVSMQGGIMFTILISIFTYFYYSKIEIELLPKFRMEKMASKKILIPNEAAFEKMRTENVFYKNRTYMDFLENEEDKGTGSMNPTIIALIHAVVGMLLTIFFSIFVTLILRKVVLRQ